jgi:signal transduction histidine kinase
VPVDLADLAEYAIDITEPQATATGVTAHLVRHTALTHGDPTLLEHLTTNLVINATRHNRPGGWLRIHTDTRPDGTVTMVIANSGPTVHTDHIDQIFEPFRRLTPDRTGTSGGAGLGLSIARAIAHAHGGEITAQPRPAGGLTVRVVLPPAPPPSAGQPPS